MYATVATSDEIQVVVGGTPTTVTYYCSYENMSGVAAVKSGVITSATTATLVPSPSPVSSPNRVLAISIYTVSAGGPIPITVQYYDGANNEILLEITLAGGYTLTYTADGSGWVVLDDNGVRQ